MRFVYIIHDPGSTESRLTDVLHALGHSVEYRCHRTGDLLPSVDEFDGVIIGGGRTSVWQSDDEPFMEREIAFARGVVDAGVPYFGIGLGGHILAAAYGSTTSARSDGVAEFGFYELEPTPAAADLFSGLDHVYQVHWEAVHPLPEEAVLLASTEAFEVQAFRIGSNAYGFQFHPDAREDMIESWWHENTAVRVRSGTQSLAEQLEEAARFEQSRALWLSRFVDRWLGAQTAAQ